MILTDDFIDHVKGEMGSNLQVIAGYDDFGVQLAHVRPDVESQFDEDVREILTEQLYYRSVNDDLGDGLSEEGELSYTIDVTDAHIAIYFLAESFNGALILTDRTVDQDMIEFCDKCLELLDLEDTDPLPT